MRWEEEDREATVREALKQCGRTRYAVVEATGIPESALFEFVEGGPHDLRGEDIDKLADYLGLALTAKAGKARKDR
jgi:hypothetical protein